MNRVTVRRFDVVRTANIVAALYAVIIVVTLLVFFVPFMLIGGIAGIAGAGGDSGGGAAFLGAGLVGSLIFVGPRARLLRRHRLGDDGDHRAALQLACRQDRWAPARRPGRRTVAGRARRLPGLPGAIPPVGSGCRSRLPAAGLAGLARTRLTGRPRPRHRPDAACRLRLRLLTATATSWRAQRSRAPWVWPSCCCSPSGSVRSRVRARWRA